MAVTVFPLPISLLLLFGFQTRGEWFELCQTSTQKMALLFLCQPSFSNRIFLLVTSRYSCHCGVVHNQFCGLLSKVLADSMPTTQSPKREVGTTASSQGVLSEGEKRERVPWGVRQQSAILLHFSLTVSHTISKMQKRNNCCVWGTMTKGNNLG